MELILTSPQQRLAQGEQVSLEIQGLQQRPEGGTYIVRWNIEPPGAITPVGDDIYMDGENKIYSVFGAALPAPPRVAFEMRAVSVPVTVTAEVRYVPQQISPAAADGAYPGAEVAAAAQATVPASVVAASVVPAAGAPGDPGTPPTGGGTGAGGTGAGAGGTGAAQAAAAAPVEVTMRRAAVEPTASQALWTLIRQSTNALSFRRYQLFMERLFTRQLNQTAMPGSVPLPTGISFDPKTFAQNLPWKLPFPGVEPYHQLKAATEVFVMLNSGVPFGEFLSTTDTKFMNFISPSQQWLNNVNFPQNVLQDERRRYYNQNLQLTDIAADWQRLLMQGQAADRDLDRNNPLTTILYLALVRANLPGVHVAPTPVQMGQTDLSPEAWMELNQGAMAVMGILREKLTNPPFLDLIWNYWNEEGGLVQTMNAISWRFQNRRGPGDRDPLAGLEIDPLRPLNGLIWGYIQDEQHRLTVVRRAHEYAHAYGLTLLGKAVPEILPADSRPRFIESLHNLLHQCAAFYKEDDDTTIVADGFPVLNALKDVHLQLAAGASNQYGDLPWTARLEMLMQQWLLARPEFREFLPRRIMIDYPEAWMHSVESMKTLQGWSSASVLHFRDLAVFGEQILLSIRYEAWPSIIEPQAAANWARYWRPEIQGYCYAYRAATGVDVTQRPDATPPPLLLRERLRQGAPRDGRGQLGPSGGRGRLTADGRGQLERPRPVVELPMASRLEETGLDR
jgi:hypothetical protein